MNRSDEWEVERCAYELLKQTYIFKYWKKNQFTCQTGKCAWCRKPMQYRWAETDHIKPLYYGGTSEPTNMVICHHNCNKYKSTKTNYKRPEWIKANSYDLKLSQKYNEILKKVKGEQVGDSSNGARVLLKEKRFVYADAGKEWVGGKEVKSGVAVGNRTAASEKKKNFGAGLFVSVVVLIVAFGLIGSLSNVRRNNASKVNNMDTDKEVDEKLKSYAELILASYTNFYNNYIAGKSNPWALPNDAYNCRNAGDGCTLSSYAKASMPKGYTYSVNSLGSGEIFVQPGIKPHASETNVALYKKARCGQNGTIVGGDVPRNAASVIRLSDGSYYCVQN